MSTATVIEKIKFREEMAKSCTQWKGMIEKYSITILDLYNEFDSRFPNTLTYDGFYKCLKSCSFSFDNYQKAKSYFTELTESLKK